tara:strand:- start:115 stop:933 length:819 start_codon:yes stop_codon:yes gene_type:complete
MLITFNYLYAFLIGSCIGSFINVVVYRLPNDLSIIKPRSFCPKCKTNLTWKENVPLISWLIQRGKCINCNTSVSFRYPLIELITAILFVVFIYSSPSLYIHSSNLIFNVFFSWLFLSLLICISFIDIKYFWIPQGLINFGFLSGFLCLFFIGLFNNKFIDFYLLAKGLSSSAMSFFIFESLRYLAKFIFKKDSIGRGDSKLVAMLALWLGPIGTLFAVGISYISAAIYCLVGLPLNLVRFKQVIPFAPFLSLGGLIIWLIGNDFVIKNILLI